MTVPPEDQREYERLGVIYFSRPPPPMRLTTIDSPILKRAGCDKNGFEMDGNTAPTAGGKSEPRAELMGRISGPQGALAAGPRDGKSHPPRLPGHHLRLIYA